MIQPTIGLIIEKYYMNYFCSISSIFLHQSKFCWGPLETRRGLFMAPGAAFGNTAFGLGLFCRTLTAVVVNWRDDVMTQGDRNGKQRVCLKWGKRFCSYWQRCSSQKVCFGFVERDTEATFSAQLNLRRRSLPWRCSRHWLYVGRLSTADKTLKIWMLANVSLDSYHSTISC